MQSAKATQPNATDQMFNTDIVGAAENLDSCLTSPHSNLPLRAAKQHVPVRAGGAAHPKHPR